MDRGQFGKWLDVTMENGEIQGKELAELLGVSPGAVSRWRSGQNIPSPQILSELAELLNVDKLQLLATAGMPGVSGNGIPSLPIPESRRRDKVREELKKIQNLKRDERQALIEAYDQKIREQEDSDD